jgi:hypothetical protein
VSSGCGYLVYLTEIEKYRISYIDGMLAIINNMREELAVITFCLCINILLLLRMSPLLGPMIKILLRMTSNIVQIGSIYIVTLIFFTAIGLFLFTYSSTFSSVMTALLYLFNATLGSFDYSVFDSTNSFDADFAIIGKIYIVVWIVVSYILLVNLLIAVLTSTYQIYMK